VNNFYLDSRKFFVGSVFLSIVPIIYYLTIHSDYSLNLNGKDFLLEGSQVYFLQQDIFGSMKSI